MPEPFTEDFFRSALFCFKDAPLVMTLTIATAVHSELLIRKSRFEMIKTRTLYCNTTRALEGVVRRAIAKAGATILTVEHGTFVAIDFSLPETAANDLVALLNEAGHGQIVWRNAEK